MLCIWLETARKVRAMNKQDKIDGLYMRMAQTWSENSYCERRKVGALLVKNQMIISDGYNGTPSKVESCYERGECYRIKNNIESGTKYETCRSIHAEQNAIIQAGQDRCQGATMYIWGHNFICILCKRFIVQSGITNVVLRKDENSPILHVTVEDLRRELEA